MMRFPGQVHRLQADPEVTPKDHAIVIHRPRARYDGTGRSHEEMRPWCVRCGWKGNPLQKIPDGIRILGPEWDAALKARNAATRADAETHICPKKPKDPPEPFGYVSMIHSLSNDPRDAAYLQRVIARCVRCLWQAPKPRLNNGIAAVEAEAHTAVHLKNIQEAKKSKGRHHK